MSRARYGRWGKPLQIRDIHQSFNNNPKVREKLAEAVADGQLMEGTGAPEGRADFPNFLLAVIRYKVRESFARRESVWRQYVGIESAQDFRTNTTSELGNLSGMGPVDERQRYNVIRSSEAGGPSYAVGKHGGVYGVTMEMVINDEVDRILNRTPTELGRMSAAYLSRVIVALVESNPTYIDGTAFFHSSRGNLYTGSAAEPSETNVLTMLTNMQNQKDADGFPLDIEPAKVVTQNQLTASVFRRMIRSEQTGVVINDPAATTFAMGNYNALKGVLPEDAVIIESYMQDPNDFFILADNDRPAFIVAFLRGQQEPFIGIEDSGISAVGGGGKDLYDLWFDVIRYKVRHIFGVQAWEPKSAVKAVRT